MGAAQDPFLPRPEHGPLGTGSFRCESGGSSTQGDFRRISLEAAGGHFNGDYTAKWTHSAWETLLEEYTSYHHARLREISWG
jgi:hypothetical protein